MKDIHLVSVLPITSFKEENSLNNKSSIINFSNEKEIVLIILSTNDENEQYIKLINDLNSCDYNIIVCTDGNLKYYLKKENILYVNTPWRYFDEKIINIQDVYKFTTIFTIGSNGENIGKKIFGLTGVPLKNSFTPGVKLNPSLQKQSIIPKKEIVNNTLIKSNCKILIDTLFNCPNRGKGDILMITALLPIIKEKYPDSTITFLLKKDSFPLLENNKYIDEYVDILVDSKYGIEFTDYNLHLVLEQLTEQYDNALNNGNRIEAIAKLFDLDINKINKPEIYLKEEEFENNLLEHNKINIGISIESISKARSWPLKYLLELIKLLDNKKYNFILFGEKEIKYSFNNNVINLTGKTTLRELLLKVAQLDFLIATDSLISHIGAAFEIPSIFMYTIKDGRSYVKYYKKASYIQSPIDCSPCLIKDKFLKNKNLQNCWKEYPECTLQITPKMVQTQFKKLIRGIKK